MSTPFNECRFNASFVVPLGTGSKKTRRLTGTMKVAEGTTDLVAVVVGTLVAIAKEEKLGEVSKLRVTASAIRPKPLRSPRPLC